MSKFNEPNQTGMEVWVTGSTGKYINFINARLKIGNYVVTSSVSYPIDHPDDLTDTVAEIVLGKLNTEIKIQVNKMFEKEFNLIKEQLNDQTQGG
jgi:hypothetical protein